MSETSDHRQREIRFGAYVRELTVQQREVSYNDLAPKPIMSPDGEALPYRPERVDLRPIDAYRLIAPYLQMRLMEQLRAVIPLALYLMLFQILILNQDVANAGIITAGLLAVILGLMLFMEGLKVGLMPFGEMLGSKLPSKATLPVVLIVTFMLGIGVTFAEPAIGALKTAGAGVDVTAAPLLWSLLNQWADVLVLVVGASVGLAAVLGTMRFLYGWSLKPMIYITLAPVLALTVYMSGRPELAVVLGLAWDSGAVTTGPVTVPLVLSLGIGIAASASKASDTLSGFGIVTLASLFPILGVMGLALFVSMSGDSASIIAAAQAAQGVTGEIPWYESTPGVEIVLGIRAIVPLVLFLLFVLSLVLKERLHRPGIISYGIALCVLGMVVFNLGLTYGLSMLGGQSGSMVPGAFTSLEHVAGSPLFNIAMGVTIALLFAWFLGFGATLAEPALNALGATVEHLTNGAFRKATLMYAVSFGVGCGIAIGVAKMLYGIPIAWLLLPAYSVAIVLTWLSSEAFVNVAWDSAGVTTGPVTVPLVLSMGLGFGEAVGSIDGFGILSMASIGPIIAVLSTGLIIEARVKRRHKKMEAAEGDAGQPA
jgi:Protein of unknown function (DUF1538)